ncbi:uncharacterized protein JCM10292_004775 [Rhodotorula paludigena]|uniref:uncharacterized protein n=1 Tax=Rhodotorula paludigena TaxID=86838 RepID=UPI00317E10CE
MSFAAYSRDDSYSQKAPYDSHYAAPQGSRTVPNSPSLGHHHAPPRSSAFSSSTAYAMNGGYDTADSLLADPSAASTSAHYIVSPDVGGHHSQPTSPVVGGNGGYYTTFEPAHNVSQPHSRAPSPRHYQQSRAPPHASAPQPAMRRALTPEPVARQQRVPVNAAAPTLYGNSLRVIQWTPQHGDEGTQVSIVLDASAVRNAKPSQFSGAPAVFGGNTGSPVLSSPRKGADVPNRRFAVVFGQAPAPTRFTRASVIDGNGVGQSMSAGPNEDDAFVVLTTFVPARETMGAPGERVMVLVNTIEIDSGAVVESCIVGEWDPAATAAAAPPASSGPSAAAAAPIPATPTRVNALKRSGDDLTSGREAPGLRSPANGSVHGSPVRMQGEWSTSQYGSPSLGHSQSMSTVNGADDDAYDQQPQQPVASGSGGAGGYARQPDLVRTSQIQANKTGHGATLSHKVVLRLQGDLNTMAMGWTNEEWTNRRRLIQFWPQQDGNFINVGFRPIPQGEYVQNSIVISCIFRDDYNECFVTSVDTIYLLEALVGSRFTVEEKNRIRRNLEGFKPATVSKSKPENEAFFKLIMGFPAPKPRNIEKDVKVFPWKILGLALKKIMSKYSANYPLGTTDVPQGQPIPTVTEPSPTETTPQPSPRIPHASPHISHNPSPRIAHSSPHIAHASPHLSHQHVPTSSSHLAPSPHIPHHSSPHLVQSPHLGGGRSSQQPSPLLTRSPQGSHPGRAAYSSYAASSSYPGSAQPDQGEFVTVTPPGSLSDSGGHQAYYAASSAGPPPAQQHLFPAAEDYGVPASHQQQHERLHPAHPHTLHAPHPHQQHQPHAHSHANSNHLRSYSEGVQYAQQQSQQHQLQAYEGLPPGSGAGVLVEEEGA